MTTSLPSQPKCIMSLLLLCLTRLGETLTGQMLQMLFFYNIMKTTNLLLWFHIIASLKRWLFLKSKLVFLRTYRDIVIINYGNHGNYGNCGSFGNHGNHGKYNKYGNYGNYGNFCNHGSYGSYGIYGIYGHYGHYGQFDKQGHYGN